MNKVHYYSPPASASFPYGHHQQTNQPTKKATIFHRFLLANTSFLALTTLLPCAWVSAGMLGKALASPLLTCNYAPRTLFSTPDVVTAAPNIAFLNDNSHFQNPTTVAWTLSSPLKKWLLRSTVQIENTVLTEEDKKSWEECRDALSTYNFSSEEVDKILGKAFGLVHSPYWGEERKKIVPKLETVNEILDYLRSLNLSDDDLSKVLKKFPEVLGCNFEAELKANVQILEKEWEIKGKSLRNLLLRNPRVLGYNIDCKGDCMAQCTRCWARF